MEKLRPPDRIGQYAGSGTGEEKGKSNDYRKVSKEFALYVTLPGYQGLYFQGVAENIKTEDFGFEAQMKI